MPGDVAHIAFPFRESFDYAVPPEMAETLSPGMPVLVPLGAQRLIGYVITRHDSSKYKLRPIVRIVDEVPRLPDDLLKLAHFVADYYMARLGDVLRMIVPTPMRRKVLRHYHLTESGKSLANAQPEHPVAKVRRVRTVASLRKALKTSAKEMNGLLDEWIRDGFVEVRERLSIGGDEEEDAAPALHTQSVFTPRPEQAHALTALHAAQDVGAYKGFLLYGVTGSGKTEVYLATIARTLAQKKTAIVLVPEIGLTPQLEARFRTRFGDDVVTIHSGLTPKQRRAAWTRVQSGAARVVVGPRSALFAPLPDLGVVIVDEEHDDSYKQDETPRYHARDTALVRAQLAGAICVLGSATPSLETLHNVSRGKLSLLEMHERATGGSLPTVEIVKIGDNDPNEPKRREHKTGHSVELFTPRLTELVFETVAKEEQVILFLNRRGFAPYVLCRACGEGIKCDNCSVSLTHHLKRGVLMCHYCNHTEPIPDVCPKCQNLELRIMGSGTERLEVELKRVFPAARIGRLDRDIVDHPKVMEDTLAAFRNGELDILVGTQMVTKGHDFPKVTLVGVLLADSGLNFPDFRAAERTAQLLVQVAGRAGRAERPGRVVVQTFHPEHPALIAAATHDYRRFAKHELMERAESEYPPVNRLVLIRLEDADRDVLLNACATLQQELVNEGLSVLGPTPCPLERLKGDWRWMMMLKDTRGQRMKEHLRAALKRCELPRSTKLVLDVDPVSML